MARQIRLTVTVGTRDARSVLVIAMLVMASLTPGGTAAAQQRPESPTPQTPRATATVDLAGYWVSVVTEDWIERMVTPAKGDVGGVPLNARGHEVANMWDPGKDTAAGNQCKAYGVGGLMRQPGRVHITWADDTTLQIEADAGMQKRLLHFDALRLPAGPPQWQGYSVASWGPKPGRSSLKVVTTRMRPGYLRLNGVPYSGNAVVTEYFDRTPPPDESWLIVETIVDDPEFLTEPFVTSTHFKREADGSKWSPRACEATRAVLAR